MTSNRLLPGLAGRSGAATILGALLLVGCQSGPASAPADIETRFAPRILDNDTKLFTFTAILPKRSPGPSLSDIGRQNEPALDRWVQALFAENAYCRDGYLTLDHYRTARQAVLRGECREAATAADRRRFASGARQAVPVHDGRR